MTIKKRRLWLGVLMFFTLAGSLLVGNPSQAHAAMLHQNAPSQQKHASNDNLTYYGADLQTMTTATGIDFQQPNTIATGAPWPQATGNYCFVSVVQAIVNYTDLKHGRSMRYPTQNDQGPSSGDPADETEGQILYDMDHHMIPHGGPLQVVGSGANRRPYALSNIAYDFGGDPETQAVATAYETPFGEAYHEHIFHNGPQAATLGIAKALALYSEPVIALVNHGEHSVLVAGVWATGNPLTDENVQIDSLAIYNPWDQKNFGTYLSASYYTRVSYNDWINAANLPSPWPASGNSWFAKPYNSNGNLDPDPFIGIYQAGAGTSNPDAHHWIGNYVIIQRDYHLLTDPHFTFDEDDHIMLKP